MTDDVILFWGPHAQHRAGNTGINTWLLAVHPLQASPEDLQRDTTSPGPLTCALKEQLPIAEPPHKCFVIFTPCHCQGVGLGVQAHTKHRCCPKRDSMSKEMGLPPRFQSFGTCRKPTPLHPKQHVFPPGKKGCIQVLLSFKHQVVGEVTPQGCQAPRPSPGQIPLQCCPLHQPALMLWTGGGCVCSATALSRGCHQAGYKQGGEQHGTGSL